VTYLGDGEAAPSNVRDTGAAYFREPREVVPEAHERILCERNRSYFKL